MDKIESSILPCPHVEGCASAEFMDKSEEGHPGEYDKARTTKGDHLGLMYSELQAQDPTAVILITEGEMDAAAALSAGAMDVVGLPGANPGSRVIGELVKLVAGRLVILAPDPDPAGEKFQKVVGADLVAAGCQVRVIAPIQGMDLDDRLQAADDPRLELFQMMEDAIPFSDLQLQAPQDTTCSNIKVSRVVSQIPLNYRPFPVDLLPHPISSWVKLLAKSIPCDPSMIALPALSVLAAAIGATRRIALKTDWKEPAVLWTVIVALSGGTKSPALDAALRPLREIERAAWRRYKEELAQFTRDLQDYKDVPKDERSGIPPQKPVHERVIASDATIEALAAVLLDNLRGVLLARDEIAGFFEGMGQYKGGKSDDQAKWLEMYGARALRIDRKTGDVRFIFVPYAAVSVTGGIQPSILQRDMGQVERKSGLLSRFLSAYPPETTKRWTDTEVSWELTSQIVNIIKRLRSLDFIEGPEGDPEPMDLYLEPAARDCWVQFVNQHGEETVSFTDEDLRAAWAKLEGATARLALILHLTAWAANPALPSAGPVKLEHLERAIGLSDWFKHETRRVYAMLGENESQKRIRQIFEAVHRLGGRATPRDLMRAMRRDYQGDGAAERAEADLQGLAKAGWGDWLEREPGAQGGRPTFELVLKDAAPGHNPQKPEEIPGSVVSSQGGREVFEV